MLQSLYVIHHRIRLHLRDPGANLEKLYKHQCGSDRDWNFLKHMARASPHHSRVEAAQLRLAEFAPPIALMLRELPAAQI